MPNKPQQTFWRSPKQRFSSVGRDTCLREPGTKVSRSQVSEQRKWVPNQRTWENHLEKIWETRMILGHTVTPQCHC